ncbi:tetratricopeptide repeat protein [Chenggangzhangella methanolivorans]|uniref:Tetratricopeptide repeat protein n=1 Tax=Chenggangzhangella methanolivorans TaxID=1437009 RepID=A0A9E6RCD0_9HYPH|nr:tetratricopeptide repeat protein [Chenggangzhangella methanolivorans]QZN98475.1 tetratricopeptide repeat protein [Chenggangzhangella methanolivorans]
MKRTGVVLVLCSVAALAGCKTTSPTAEVVGTPEEARLVQLARDIEARGEPGTAVALYARAIEASGGSAAAYVRLGDAQAKAGDPDGARAAYQEALSRDPKHPGALLGVGTADLNAGAAEAAARRLSEAAPLVNTATAYNRLGAAYVMEGRAQEAAAAFQKARALDPSNIDIAGNLALAQALAGQTEAAVAGMQAAAQSPAAKGRHRRNLIVVLSLAGRYDEAQAVSVPDMSAKQKIDLLARVRKLQTISDPVARARAVGLVANA